MNIYSRPKGKGPSAGIELSLRPAGWEVTCIDFTTASPVETSVRTSSSAVAFAAIIDFLRILGAEERHVSEISARLQILILGTPDPARTVSE